MIVGIEVGGTFTDLVMVGEGGEVRVHKLPSTPADPAVAAVDGFEQLLGRTGVNAADVGELLHGSTIAANALIQRRGARTALVTTRGFRDVLFIQRQDRTSVYDMYYRKPEPLIARDRVFEVTERLDARGDVVVPLDVDGARETIRQLLDAGIESVAVCLLHAYASPAHERALGEMIREAAPGMRVSLSSDVAPEHREYERTSTTLIDAFVGPAVERYLEHYGQRVGALGFAGTPLIMQSNGGVVPISSARRLAAGMFVSGPAAAVTAAAEVARRAGQGDVISVDVGGTSCDVCLIADGVARTTGKGTAEFSIEGLPLNVVMTDIVTIGAGGGSIAAVDPGGMLQVGPQSAGADPGPACYGRGGEDFCLTDAMLLLGLLDPRVPLPGEIVLAPGRSRAAAAALCERFALSEVDLAARVYRIAVANMAQALRRVSVTRGFDPRRFALLPCGGAGPLIAAALADEVGIDRILLPPHPGIFSAYGLAVADLRMDYVRADGAVRADALSGPALAERLDGLARRAAAEFAALGHDPGALELRFSADVRSLGQGYELRVELDRDGVRERGVDALVDPFHALHEQQYGYAARKRPVEIVSLRLAAVLARRAPPLAPVAGGGARPRADRRVDLHEPGAHYAVRARDALRAGEAVRGPVMIVEPTTSTPLPAGWSGRVLDDGAILVQRSGS